MVSISSRDGTYVGTVAPREDGQCCLTVYRLIPLTCPHPTRAGAVVSYRGRRLVSCTTLPGPFHSALDAAHDRVWAMTR